MNLVVGMEHPPEDFKAAIECGLLQSEQGVQVMIGNRMPS